jgi:Zn-dependent protease/predicted transcriptional regulator
LIFGSRITLFHLFGISIRLDPSWVLLAVLITWTLAVGFFPASHPGLATTTYWLMGAIAAIGLFVSIILHEMAHAVVARRDGLEIDGITLFIFGGVAEMKAEPASPMKEFRMAIAGPIASVGVAVVCYLVALAGGLLGAGAAFTGVFAYLAVINTILVVFNMVPAFPLDGGRVLRAGLWAWKGSLRRATRISATIGGGFGIALIVLGLLNVLTGNFIGGIWWALIGLFVRFAAQMSYQQVLVKKGLEGVPVKQLMNPQPISVSPDLAIADLVEDYVYRYHFKLFPVVHDDNLVGCVRLADIKEIPRDRWGTTRVAEIMQACTPETTVSPDTSAVDLLQRIQPPKEGRVLVTQGGRLEGIISRHDLFAYLAVKSDLEAEEHGAAQGSPRGWDRVRSGEDPAC